MDDYFQILGVSENISDEDLKKQYKKLALELHPDRNPGNRDAEEKFKKVSAAYDVLSNPQKKAEYLNQRMFDNRKPSGNPFEFHFNFGGGSPFADPFSHIFGGGHQGMNQFRNVEVVHQIRLEDVLNGKDQETITYSVAGTPQQSIKINIPKGIDHGMKMRFAGAHKQPNGAQTDLFINIHVAPHPKFVKEGINLVTSADVSVIDAMIGAEITLLALDGSLLRTKIPAGAQFGQRIRLQGKGLPSFNNTKIFGDLYVSINIKMPTNLSENQIKYLRDFRNIS